MPREDDIKQDAEPPKGVGISYKGERDMIRSKPPTLEPLGSRLDSMDEHGCQSTFQWENEEPSLMKPKPPAKICLESIFQELEEALYGNMSIRSHEEDGQAMNIDELFDKYIFLPENEDDTSSDLEPTIDDFQGSAFGDMAKPWEPKMESLEPVIELTLHLKRHLPYKPTILMARCSFFPSFVDEEVEMEESQE